MSVSRREFFVGAFGKAINYIHTIIPSPIKKVLCNPDEPLSPEDAAFALVSSRRKSSSEAVNPRNLFK